MRSISQRLNGDISTPKPEERALNRTPSEHDRWMHILGYLLDTELRNQHLEAALVIIEVVVIAVLFAAVRSSRRRL